MRVSIIIRAYNAEHTIERALQSALNQDYPAGEYEIIVVNDGSRDATAHVLEKYRAHPNVRLIYQENQGAVRAANRGFEESVGEYVVLLDADDEFDPSCIKTLAARLDKNLDVAFAYPSYVEEYQGITKAVDPQDIFQTIAIGTMFRRALLLREGGYREGVFFAEYDLLLRTRRAWNSFHVPKILMTYHRRIGSETGRRTMTHDPVTQGLKQLEELHPDKISEIKKIRGYALG